MPTAEPIDETDLFSDAVRCDPYPHYRRLRRDAPLYRSPRLDAWVVTSHRDATVVLTHPAGRHWAGNADDDGFTRTVGRWMSMLDPRQQRRMRRLVGPIFTPRAIAGLRAELYALADRLLDDAAPSGGLDVVTGYAEPIALAGIARIIGVPAAQAPTFHATAPSLTGSLLAAIQTDGTATGDKAEPAGIELLSDLLAERGDPPSDSLLAVLRQLDRDGELRDQTEALAFLLLFLFAGHENMMNFIGNATYALVDAPDRLAELRRTSSLDASAVDELLRFDSPVQFMTVSLADAVTLRDQRIPVGETILVGIGAANRDEDRFPNPDRLDFTRQDRGHLTFGQGPFACIGAALARLEGEVALGALVRRMSRPAIRGPLRLRRDPPVLRGFVSLDLAFDA